MDQEVVGRLSREVERLAGRLRSMSDVRLRAPFPGEGSRAAGALELAQRLADAAQGVEERASPHLPHWRVVPELVVFALGDQVAVTGTDLVAVAGPLPPDEAVWTRTGRGPLGEVVTELTAAARELRLAL